MLIRKDAARRADVVLAAASRKSIASRVVVFVAAGAVAAGGVALSATREGPGPGVSGPVSVWDVPLKARSGAGFAVTDRYVAVVGGESREAHLQSREYDPVPVPMFRDGVIFDRETGTWSPLPRLPFEPAIHDPELVFVDDDLVVVGTRCEDEARVGEEIQPQCLPGSFAAASWNVGARTWTELKVPEAIPDTPGLRGVYPVAIGAIDRRAVFAVSIPTTPGDPRRNAIVALGADDDDVPVMFDAAASMIGACPLGDEIVVVAQDRDGQGATSAATVLRTSIVAGGKGEWTEATLPAVDVLAPVALIGCTEQAAIVSSGGATANDQIRIVRVERGGNASFVGDPLEARGSEYVRATGSRMLVAAQSIGDQIDAGDLEVPFSPNFLRFWDPVDLTSATTPLAEPPEGFDIDTYLSGRSTRDTLVFLSGDAVRLWLVAIPETAIA